LPHCSRRRTQAAIEAGEVRVNGRRSRKGAVLSSGDRVVLEDQLAELPALIANPSLPVPILYEDEALVAVNKPAGLAAHALQAADSETIANFLLAHYPEMRGVGAPPLEAGLVHRLDTETSGVMLAARTAAAYAALRQQFRDRTVTKEYLALVAGDVRSAGELRCRLAADQRDRRKVRVVDAAEPAASGRLAITRYEPRQRFGRATLLAVQIVTGERHQIRAQLAAIARPVIGDKLYGSNRTFNAPRHLLHALRLIITHPVSGERLSIAAPLPADFKEWCERLGHSKA
jgi:23S rRNA pseudouridine1911/1915/1917 synthase